MVVQACIHNFEACRKEEKAYLLKELEPPCQELILDFQEIALAHVHLKGLIDDAETAVILDVLPPAVSVSHNTLTKKTIEK